MIRAYRIVKTRRALTAFDGEGARLVGGRWNSVGTPMVYLAESSALAAMEMLVHFDESSLIAAYSLIAVEFPETCVSVAGESGGPPLPSHWAQTPAPIECAQVGDRWVQSAHSLLLRVPSAVVPYGQNYFLNPSHPDWSQLQIGAPQSFPFDARLLEKLAVGVAKQGESKS